MADLTTTITENVVLNGSVRGSTNTLNNYRNSRCI